MEAEHTSDTSQGTKARPHRARVMNRVPGAWVEKGHSI